MPGRRPATAHPLGLCSTRHAISSFVLTGSRLKFCRAGIWMIHRQSPHLYGATRRWTSRSQNKNKTKKNKPTKKNNTTTQNKTHKNNTPKQTNNTKPTHKNTYTIINFFDSRCFAQTAGSPVRNVI